MPLTNAQKQARARDKRARTMARWERALREVAEADFNWISDNPEWAIEIAQKALNPETWRVLGWEGD